jgi:hypothetical protein
MLTFTRQMNRLTLSSIQNRLCAEVKNRQPGLLLEVDRNFAMKDGGERTR